MLVNEDGVSLLIFSKLVAVFVETVDVSLLVLPDSVAVLVVANLCST
jgi:hypothetical protein